PGAGLGPRTGSTNPVARCLPWPGRLTQINGSSADRVKSVCAAIGLLLCRRSVLCWIDALQAVAKLYSPVSTSFPGGPARTGAESDGKDACFHRAHCLWPCTRAPSLCAQPADVPCLQAATVGRISGQ